MRHFYDLAAGLLLAGASLSAPEPAAAAEPGQQAPNAAAADVGTDQLLFTSMRTGVSQIFRIDADGRNEVRLTQTDTAELQPAFSAQGRIAFVSYRSGGGDIYTMNADGSGVLRVTTSPVLDQNPVWSPDGRRIAYVSQSNGSEVLCVVNADGTDEAVITGSLSEAGSPQWSPDGKRIAFVARVEQRSRIHLVDLATGSMSLLTNDKVNETGPTWSPDGTALAFVQSSRTEGTNIRLVRLGSKEVVALTRSLFLSSNPRFSPDGSKLLLLSNAGTASGLLNLHVINADGSGLTNLTSWPHADLSAAWSRDGKHIFLMSYRDFPGQVYRVDATGRDTQRLTRSSAQDGFPVTRPVSGFVLSADRAR